MAALIIEPLGIFSVERRPERVGLVPPTNVDPSGSIFCKATVLPNSGAALKANANQLAPAGFPGQVLQDTSPLRDG
jgi:hypothetical protein